MPLSDRTTERPVALTRRQDLVIVPQHFRGERFWIVKDPLSFRFVRLREGEFAIFEALNGRNSLNDLALLYETRFTPQRIRTEEISRFIGTLHQAGLLVSERPGQGTVLRKRGDDRRRRERRARWLNPLAVRFRGIDPTRLFDILEILTRPLFTRTALIASLLFTSSAALLIAVRWTTFAARMPSLHEFFTPSNLIVLGVVTAGVKVLHEFGHGLACRHFGGETHELGAMLLVFTPCLYCDVTDSWRFPSKWRRAAVGAAGIFVELNLAAAATFVWWFSQPGLLNQLCLNVMTVASVGTVLFNGNPLMRYDGYYILSDLSETPNLAERSSAVLRRLFSRVCLGIDEPPDPLVPADRVGRFAAYAAASGIYRWIVTFSIILFLVAAARPYRLEHAARLLGLLGAGALIMGPLLRLRQLVTVPGTWQRMRMSRILLSSAIVLGLGAAVAFVPLPHRVFGPLEIQPLEATPLYVDVPGRLIETAARYGDTLNEGAPIARLENHDVELAVEELTARRDRHRTELASLRREQFDSPAASLSIPRTVKLLESLESLLAEKRRDLTRLTIDAPRGGMFFPPTDLPATEDDENLIGWSGRPLDAINLGCTAEGGLLLGQIGDPHRRQAVIVLEQEDIEFVRVGDAVEILLDALPQQTLSGSVDEIAIGEMREAPRRLSNKAGGELSTKSTGGSAERPVSTSYQVRVHVEDPDGMLRVGWRGTARIRVAALPLGSRVLRSLSRTFHFQM